MAQVHLIGPPPVPRSGWVRIGGALGFLCFATVILVLAGALMATENSRSTKTPLRAATDNAASTLGLQEGWLMVRQFCSPGRKHCVSVQRQNRLYSLTLVTKAERRGRAQVCVRSRGGVECRETKIRTTADGARQARLSWNKEFPTAAHGRRTAKFFVDGRRVGPALPFTPR